MKKKSKELRVTTLRLSQKHLTEEIRKALVDIRNHKDKDTILEIKGHNKYIEAYAKPTIFGSHHQPFIAIASAFAEKTEKLMISSVFLDNWLGLEKFYQLKFLNISLENSDKVSSKDFPPLDFNNYPSLEWFSTWGLWNTKNLRTSNIKELIYVAYGQNKKDLSASELPMGLRRLEIKYDSLSSLSGIETAEHLEAIELYHLRSLKDISVLEKLTKLNFLFINKSCPKINYDNFPYLPNLKKLYISSNIPSLSFLQKTPNVEDFGFWNEVADGDMHPILALQHLKECFFTTKKKFSHSYEQVCLLKGIVPNV